MTYNPFSIQLSFEYTWEFYHPRQLSVKYKKDILKLQTSVIIYRNLKWSRNLLYGNKLLCIWVLGYALVTDNRFKIDLKEIQIGGSTIMTHLYTDTMMYVKIVKASNHWKRTWILIVIIHVTNQLTVLYNTDIQH